MVKKNKRHNESLNKDEGKITPQKTECRRLRNEERQKAKELRRKKRFQRSKRFWADMLKDMNSNDDEK
jgi:hypothetical protein